jgi:hypothetical protein
MGSDRWNQNIEKAGRFWKRVIRGGERAPLVGDLPPQQESDGPDVVIEREETSRERFTIDERDR